MLAGAVVRGSELVGLEREDMDAETGRILIGGKGGKERVAWLSPRATSPCCFSDHGGEPGGTGDNVAVGDS
jgi:site-specific recombinase XerD